MTWFGYGGALCAGVLAGLADEALPHEMARAITDESQALVRDAGVTRTKG